MIEKYKNKLITILNVMLNEANCARHEIVENPKGKTFDEREVFKNALTVEILNLQIAFCLKVKRWLS